MECQGEDETTLGGGGWFRVFGCGECGGGERSDYGVKGLGWCFCVGDGVCGCGDWGVWRRVHGLTYTFCYRFESDVSSFVH